MEYKTHKLGGLCAGAIAASVYLPKLTQTDFININLELFIPISAMIVAGAIGSAIPDIDHPNSHVSRKNPLISLIVQLFLGMANLFTTILLFLCFWIDNNRKAAIKSGMGHRGIFHTLVMGLAIFYVSGLLAYLNAFYGHIVQIGLTAGYLSHLLVDMMTTGGVMLFYPIITFHFRWPLLNLKTGKNETLGKILILLVGIITVYLLYKY